MTKAQDIKQYLKLLKAIKQGKEGSEMIPITKGKQESAIKIVFYGPEGIGKSTIASQCPDPVFIDTEGSTKQLDVARYPKPEYWKMILDELEDALEERNCKTIVIDTADWAEQLCIQEVCSMHSVKGIEDIGYGKGYVYVAEKFAELLRTCDKLVEAGINVVFTAHAMMRKFEQPDELGAYDRWEMKLSKKVAPLLKEWADMVLFCNYKTTVITDSKTQSKKASGGKRVMYASHHPCWDAKNRFGLPEQMEMSFDQIAHLFTVQTAPNYRTLLRNLISNKSPEEKQEIVARYNLGPDSTNEDYKIAYETLKGGN